MATQEEKISAIQHILKAEYNSTRWKTFLSELFTSSNFFSSPATLPGINGSIASQALHIGSINIIENGISRNIAIYEVTLADNVVLERNRVGLRNLLKPHWKQQDAAFIIYHHPQDKSWRFSYVSELKTFNEAGEYVDNKTEPKRYTYVLGENESCRTAAIQFSKLQDKASNATLDDIKEAFSVEKMSKEFFDTYKDHYQDFVQFLTGKRLEKVAGKWEEVVKHAPNTQLITIFNNNEKDVRDFCKKLLGRIVFLYFIQKKGWLGVPLHDKWGNGKPDFISRLLVNCRNPSIFYSEYLSKLFFETLNQPRPDDLAEIIPGEKTRVPYLNGGLFEEDDPNQRGLIFEAELFKDLFAFFDQYNFTIYEDDPNDHTVAVDPEMLGHIFENLLEDNKDKGAFYTPKEIVHYMCQESLIEYLTTWFEGKNYQVKQDTFISFDNAQQASFLSANDGRTGQGVLEIAQPAQSSSKVINRSLIEKLLKKQLSDEDKQAVIKHAAEFNDALDKVKICDPAIGSGAFPMGLLLEIFTAKQTIHTFTHGDLTTFEPATVKLNIIQNSIYGVDIERGAVDIARLRFWLSLVVDEPEPQPLPNLDYKIVVGNSLISKLGDDVIEIDWDVKKQVTFDMFGADETGKIKQTLTELNQLQKAFFNPKSDKKALAPKIRNLKIDLLIQQLNLMIETRGLKVAPRKLATQSQKDFVAQTELYLQTQGWLAQRSQLEALKTQPDKPLDFFDWQLNFSEVLNKEVAKKVGFDIVIGNPPYVDSENMIKTQAKFRDEINSKYTSAKGNWDLYIPFHEKAMSVLNSYGVKSFISPNKWISISYAAELRKMYKNSIFQLCNCNGVKVFEAGVTPVISFFKKNKSQNIRVDSTNSEFSFKTNCIVSSNKLSEDNLGILLSVNINLLMKLNSIPSRFSNYLTCENPFSTSEAYELINLLSDKLEDDDSFFKLINTGTIDPFISLWGARQTTYLKNKYLYPVANKNEFKQVFPRRHSQCISKKLIITGMRYLECFYDDLGKYIAGKSTLIIRDLGNGDLFAVFCCLLNSKLVSFYIKESFSTLGIDGGVNFSKGMINDLPLPEVNSKLTVALNTLFKKLLLTPDNVAIKNQLDSLIYKHYKLEFEEVIKIEPSFRLTENEYNSIEI